MGISEDNYDRIILTSPVTATVTVCFLIATETNYQ